MAITVHDTATAENSETIEVPAGIQAGDLIVLLDYAEEVGAPLDTHPSGFTRLLEYGESASVSNHESVMILSYKLAVGNESGQTLTGMDGDGIAKALVVFRSDPPIESVAAAVDVDGDNTNGNPDPINIPAGSQTPPLIAFGCYGSAGNISPRTMSPTKDGEVGLNEEDASAWLAWKIYESSPADVQIDMDDEGNLNTLAGAYIRLTIPAAAGVPRQMMHYRKLRI